MKKNVCTKSINDDGSVTFTFSNGEVRTESWDSVFSNVEHSAKSFAVSEKLGNFYAGSKGDPTVALAAFDAGVATLKTGTWRQTGGGGGVGYTENHDLVVAIANVTGNDRESIARMLNDIPAETKEEKAARNKAIRTLRNDIRIKAELLRLEQERAKDVPVENDILSGLMS